MKIQTYIKEEKKLSNKYRVGSLPHIIFKNKVPLTAKVAIWYLNIRGGKLDIKHFNKK